MPWNHGTHDVHGPSQTCGPWNAHTARRCLQRQWRRHGDRPSDGRTRARSEVHGGGHARSSRVSRRELVEGDDFSTVVEDARTSSLSDTESAELDAFRGIEHADIVGDGANNDSELALLATHELSDLRK